jgi:hypothetical protein
MGAYLLVTGISNFLNMSRAFSDYSALYATDQKIFFTSPTSESLQNILNEHICTITTTIRHRL